MHPRFFTLWNGHAWNLVMQGQGANRRGVLEVGRLMQKYHREQGFLADWLERQQRDCEWLALKDWWSCQSPEEYEQAKRRWGATLTQALFKWRRTERYKRNKLRYRDELGY